MIINRALVYGALATLAGTYLGSVLLLQLVLSGLHANSSLAVPGRRFPSPRSSSRLAA